MTAEGEEGRAAARERFIPVRKAELLDALLEHGALASKAERVQFRHICRSLTAIFHYEYFEQLERLRHDYFYFNPEVDPHARLTDAALTNAYGDLVDSFEAVLKDANFSEISHAEIDDILSLLVMLNEQGITVILIEHIMRAVMSFSQRLAVLVAGKKIADGEPQEVMRNPEVVRAYLGE